ncbi:MAG: CHAT domain-containing protein [Chloroflexota bacterium]|nr:CHAT domain-containing protein [Chloroflexota bacterium]MDQ5866227.1 CHAT domain-containing protein [Chloroflexota bacterium]
MGEIIGGWLFPRRAFAIFYTAREDAKAAKKALRLVLSFDNTQLAALPWELMYLPDEDCYLAHEDYITIVRESAAKYPTSNKTEGPLTKGTLRVLAVFADPKLENRVSLKLHRELQALKQVEEQLGVERFKLHLLAHEDVAQEAQKLGVKVETYGAPDHKTLADALLQGFDVLHFAGHATLSDNGMGALVVEGPNRQPKPFTADKLKVATQRGMRLAVLTACETTRFGSGDAALMGGPMSVSRALTTESGIEAVVAMQRAIHSSRATRFTKHFYQELAANVPIDACVTRARQKLYVGDDHNYIDWTAPVLFMRDVDDARLWPTVDGKAALPETLSDNGPIEAPIHEVGPKPSSPATKSLTYFVETEARAFALRRILDLLSNPQNKLHQVFAITGEEGVGTSTLLSHLWERVSETKLYNVAFIYFDGIISQDEQLQSAAWDPHTDARVSYLKYLTLLRSISEQLTGKHLYVDTPGDIQQGERAHDDAEAGRLTQLLLDNLKTVERAVIFIDEFNLPANRKITEWVTNILVPKLDQLDSAVLILGRFSSAGPLPGSKNRLETFELKSFTENEVRDCLRNSVTSREITDELVRRVQSYTGGYPLVVDLAAGLLQSTNMTYSELMRTFDRRTDPSIRDLKRLVDRMDELVRRNLQAKKCEYGLQPNQYRALYATAVEAVWVLRRFDAEILDHMSRPDMGQLEDEDYPDLLAFLCEFCFVEHHEASELDDEYWKVHEFVRRDQEQRLKARVNRQNRYAELHAKAAAYYFDKVGGYEDDNDYVTPYSRGYRYEDPKWQRLISEWLYHLAHLTDKKGRQAARRAFARVYLDAFWWWGLYLEFNFCSDLLRDWRETQLLDGDQRWIEMLEEFQKAYPTGYQKAGREQDWETVRRKLISLQSDLKVDGGVAGIKGKDNLYLRALIDIFIGDAHWHGRRDFRKAEQLYLEAYNIFQMEHEEDGEDAQPDYWNMPWVTWLLADLYLDEGQLELALSKINNGFIEVKQLCEHDNRDDREIKSNLWRVWADLKWRAGDVEGAFEGYNMALYHAYAYQAIPDPGDAYTRKFYLEMQERLVAWLQKLWSDGRHDEVRPLWDRLRKFWGEQGITSEESAEALLEKGQLPQLQTLLFPPPPQNQDFEDNASDYVVRVKEFVDVKEHYVKAGPLYDS